MTSITLLMNMVAKKRSRSVALLLMVGIVTFTFSCRDDDQQPFVSEVEFSIGQAAIKSSANGRSKESSVAASVLVSIKDDNGTTIAEHKELALHQFGENYLSVPLTLSAAPDSRYRLTEFLVVDTEGNVLYATPVDGSELAHLVKDPLTIDFSVTKNTITTVTPEVVEVDENSVPADYGYGQFGFMTVEKIQIVLSAFIKGETNFELTNAALKIEGVNDTTSADTTTLWKYHTQLAAKANIITIRKAQAYKITATKEGYKPWVRKLALKHKDAVEIILDKLPGSINIWNAHYGGSGKEYPGKTIATTDGGVIMFTWTNSRNHDATGSKETGIPQGDIWILKINQHGTVEWTRKYGGSVFEDTFDAETYPDGSGYLLTGRTTSADGDFAGLGVNQTQENGYLMKVGPDGQKIWLKVVDKVFTDIALASTGTNNFVLASTRENSGATRYDLHIRQVNESGNKVWENIYFQNSSKKHFTYNKLLYRADNGYLLVGGSKFAKIDEQGSLLWEKEITPMVQISDFSGKNAGYHPTDDGYFLYGNIASTDVSYKGSVLAKYDKQNNKIWEKLLTTTSDIFGESITDMVQKPSGNFLLTVGGGKKSSSPYAYAGIKEVTPTGDIVKEKHFSGSGRFQHGSYSTLLSIIPTSTADEFILVGFSNDTGGDIPGNYTQFGNYYDSYDIWATRVKY